MIKLLVSGVWICLITLASSYAAVSWTTGPAAGAGEEELLLKGLKYEKTSVITVPMLAEGEVQGYIIAQFVFTIDNQVLNQLSVPPHVFLVDEAFRAIYADENLDFDNLQRFDLAALTQRIGDNVNAHLQADVIEDVLVEQFNYLSKEEIRTQQEA